MNPVEGLDWLDLASCCLTRVGAFDSDRLELDEFVAWRQRNTPRWRQPLPAAEPLLQHADVLGNDPLAYLRRCGAALLVRTDQGLQLPDDWLASTTVRARLPLGTLQAAAFAEAQQAPLTPVVQLTLDQRLRRLVRETDVVDGHVHAGAIVPFDALFRLLLASDPGTNAAVAATFEDSMGATFQLGRINAYAQTLDLLLACLMAGDPAADPAALARAAGFAPDFTTAIAEGAGWSFIGEDEPRSQASARWQDLAPYAPLAMRPDPALDDPHALALNLKTAWLRKQGARPDDTLSSNATRDILRCEALLHHATTQGARTGLDEFLRASDRLRHIRRQAIGGKRSLVQHGLRFLGHGTRLRAVELRTCEQPEPSQRFRHADLARSLGEQFRGYRDYARSANEGQVPAAAAWPICLIRDGAQVNRSPSDDPREDRSLGASTTELPIRFDLRPLWRVIVVTAELLQRYPTARALVPGLDIAGDETALPSWCAHLLFDEYRRRLVRQGPAPRLATPISFRIHAGESYRTPIEGLRRIDEATRRVTPQGTPRIGHGLALIEPRWDEHDGQAGQRIDEAFDDLVWAWHELGVNGAGDDQLVRTLGSKIVDRGRELYGLDADEPLDPRDFHAAYEARFDVGVLASVGLLEPDAEAAFLFTGLVKRAPTTLQARLLTTYLTDARLSATINEPLIDIGRLRQIYSRARPIVVRHVRDAGAVVEACPTSNLVIDGIPGYDRHPMLALLAQGVSFTINTDDPGIFSTTIVDEYASIWSGMNPDTPADRATALAPVFDQALTLADWVSADATTVDLVDEVLRAWWADGLMDAEDEPAVAG